MARPWMPLYVADYLADTAHLRAAESGAYLHLIMHYWQRGGLPTDDRQLAAIAKMTAAEWRRARDTIAAFFEPGWRHLRIDHELAESEKKYCRRAEAGRKGGSAKRQEKSTEDASNASAMLNQPQPQPHKDSSGGGDAREPDHFDLALKIGVIAGYPDASHWPPSWKEAPRRVAKMLAEGWQSDLMLLAAEQAMAHKRDGPPFSINFFEKPFARAHARQAAPLPVVRGPDGPEVIHGTDRQSTHVGNGQHRGENLAARALRKAREHQARALGP